MESFKPMLFPNNKVTEKTLNTVQTGGLDLEALPDDYYLASIKRDGIRCEIGNGKMLGRSLKPFNNKYLKECFEDIMMMSDVGEFVVEGELYSDEVDFDTLSGILRSKDKALPSDLKLFLFDFLKNKKGYEKTPFQERYNELKKIQAKNVDIVDHFLINKTGAKTYFKSVTTKGFEGLILRNPNAGYKFGRVTIKENIAYKMKKINTYDVIVKDVLEQLENTGESFENELGYKTKHDYKENKVPTGMAGAFLVNYEGKEQKISLSAFTHDERKNLWNNKENVIGMTIEVCGMESSKGKVRIPTFIRWRHDK